MKRSTLASLHAALMLATAGAASAAGADFSAGPRFAARQGDALYAAVCAGCHMPQGTGAAGAAKYPPLARNDKLASAGYVTFMVVRGNKAMPGFAGQLDDEQIAAVVNYVRASFGNTWQDRIGAAEAAALRP